MDHYTYTTTYGGLFHRKNIRVFHHDCHTSESANTLKNHWNVSTTQTFHCIPHFDYHEKVIMLILVNCLYTDLKTFMNVQMFQIHKHNKNMTTKWWVGETYISFLKANVVPS